MLRVRGPRQSQVSQLMGRRQSQVSHRNLTQAKVSSAALGMARRVVVLPETGAMPTKSNARGLVREAG
jgi:hypothetical protein